jgi:hypothetical protein
MRGDQKCGEVERHVVRWERDERREALGRVRARHST